MVFPWFSPGHHLCTHQMHRIFRAGLRQRRAPPGAGAAQRARRRHGRGREHGLHGTGRGQRDTPGGFNACGQG